MNHDIELTALAAKGCPSDDWYRFSRRHEGHLRAIASFYLKAYPKARSQYGPEDALEIVRTATWQALRSFEGAPDQAVTYVRHVRHRALKRTFGRFARSDGHRTHKEAR